MPHRRKKHAARWPVLLLFLGVPARADMLLIHSTPLDVRGSRVERLRSVPFERGLFEGTGTVESPPLASDAPFDNLVGSWNAELPPDASVELDVQVRSGDAWSVWYRLGRWDADGGKSLGRQEDALGYVDIDTLKLKQSATALRYRVRLESGAEPARLLRVAFAAVDGSRPPDVSSVPFQSGPWVRELTVRPRSQMEEQERYKHDLCSPTSLSMVLDFWGKSFPTAEVASVVRDRDSQLFGNWTLNVAAASRWGLSGEVARLGGYDGLQAEIARGRPVVVSISFGEGALRGAPIRKTKGHLLVVAGFTSEGNVIAYDPAAPDRASVRRVYDRAEFARAWLADKLGLAYLLGPRFPQSLRVAVPAVDVRRHPASPAKPDPHDPERLTQLLYGESVDLLEAKGDWARVAAVEQPAFSEARGWGGYEGWIPADVLRDAAAAPAPNAVVRLKRVDLGGGLVLSIGTRLRVERGEGGRTLARLLDGRSVPIDASALRPLDPPSPPSRERILEAAEQFIGDRYVWGGRSGVAADPRWGVDCSGLVNLGYRVEGADLPRDAREQYLRAKPLRRAELRPADLVFLSKPGDPKNVSHVLLYAGGDALVESRAADPAPSTVKTTFLERFGKPLSSIESGDTVEDRADSKPTRRTIYFGGYLRP